MFRALEHVDALEQQYERVAQLYPDGSYLPPGMWLGDPGQEDPLVVPFTEGESAQLIGVVAALADRMREGFGIEV